MSRDGPAVVEVPGDKSISHRALLLAALAEGTSNIRGLLPGADIQSTAGALRALGIAIPEIGAGGGSVRVRGVGPAGLRAPDAPLDCGNSGTAARLLLGLLAGCPVTATLTGDPSLRGRPMRRVTQPLTAMGAHFEELGEPDRLPIRVRGGSLAPLAYESPRASAQVKSAILLAGLTGGAGATVTEPVLSRDHTERMLRAVGVTVRSETLPDGRARASVEPTDRLDPLDLRVPRDVSSAAYFIAAALLAGGPIRLPGVGVNPGRTGLLDAVGRMGASVERLDARTSGGEPVADLLVRPASPLCSVAVAPAEVPAMIDEIPVLAVLAARAQGETRIEGAGELRVKETDRIAAIADNLRAIGGDVEATADGLVIRGTERPFRGAVEVRGDHRIAMAFGVLAALPGNEIRIDDPGAAAVSYPDFWTDLERCMDTLRES